MLVMGLIQVQRVKAKGFKRDEVVMETRVRHEMFEYTGTRYLIENGERVQQIPFCLVPNYCGWVWRHICIGYRNI